MGLTLEQAKAELAALNNPTVDQLRDLVSRVDVGTPAGSTTLLYSGKLAQFGAETVGAGDVALELNKANPKLWIIDKTAAGEFLKSEELADTLLNAVGGDAVLRDSLLFGTDGGFWSNASERFAAGADGNVVSLSSFANPDRVFGSVELKALLDNTNVTAIDGVSLSNSGDSISNYNSGDSISN